eukprot:3260583-Ditylum_brightwellii.AAC.1
MRNTESRELNTRVRADQSFDCACLYCSALYREKQEAGEAASYQKEVHCTAMICNFCLMKNEPVRTCFLCATHFNAFHNKVRFGYRSKAHNMA